MKKIIMLILLVFLILLISNAISIEDSCTLKKTILKCSESSQILRSACAQAVGFVKEFSGACENYNVQFEYNIEDLECGDVINLKIARYSVGAWNPIETSIVSNGDGTGTATASINMPGLYALTAKENCVPTCKKNVYDMPDPVLVGETIKLGACGAKIQKEDQLKTCSQLNGICCQTSCSGGVTNQLSGASDCNVCCKSDTGCAQDTFANPMSSFQQIDSNININNLAPILFIIRRDECLNDLNVPETYCPAGYTFSGSFKYDAGDDETIQGNICGSEASKMLSALDVNLVPRQIKKGWINLCTKNNFAYLEAARNDCVYENNFDEMIASNTISMYDSVYDDNKEHSCPENSVICSVYEKKNEEGFAVLRRLVCCPLDQDQGFSIDNSIQGSIDPSGKLAYDFCDDRHLALLNNPNSKIDYLDSEKPSALVATQFKKLNNFYSIEFFKCSNIKNSIVNNPYLISSSTDHRKEDYYKKPNYAVCGGKNADSKPRDRLNGIYLCPIEQNKPCLPGYEMVGSIRVGSLGDNRCDDYYISDGGQENGINMLNKRISSGLMGLCVKIPADTTALPNDQSQIPDEPLDTPQLPQWGDQQNSIAKPAVFISYSDAGSDTQSSINCPAGYHKTMVLQGKGSTLNNLDFAYSSYIGGKPNPASRLSSGTLSLCVMDNKPEIVFCSSKEFNKGICGETEYCRDKTGKAECDYIPDEEKLFDYYAFVCDIISCPNADYMLDNKYNYYGFGDFVSCTAETCLPVNNAIKTTEPLPNIILPLPIPTPEPIQTPEPNQCVDNDKDSFFGTGSDCSDGKDCDDSNTDIHPGAEEICGNGIDEGCSGSDQICTICNIGFNDEDQDGSCSDVDCDDNNATINPNSIEICGNGIDENCDGRDELCKECNEGEMQTCYPEKEDYFYTYYKFCSKDGIYGKCSPDYELSINPLFPRPSCNDGQNWSCPRQFGVCQGSKTTCYNNQWQDCSYNSIEEYSSAETCGDDLDNNCDGSIDEGCLCNGDETKDCGITVGLCTQGKQKCSTGKWSRCDFSQAYYPKPEYLLDSKDNDCDGSVDEGFSCGSKYKPGFTRKCGKSNIMPCNYGKQSCSNETFIGLTIFSECENSINPKAETCDDLDNDCDGSVDEGCSCDEGQKKSCGIGVGVCTTGSQECKEGIFTECNDVTSPTEELCDDDLDNNCDGSTDEGCPCTDSKGNNQTIRPCSKYYGVCSQINQTCRDGTWLDCDYTSLEKYQDIETKCDDLLDNDCDNKIDESDPTKCTSTQSSRCSDGTIIGDCSESKICSKDLQLEAKCEVCDNCDAETEICSKGKCTELKKPKQTPVCGNGNCDSGETLENCPNDCESSQENCNNDGQCDSTETQENCPEDCPIEQPKEGSKWIWYALLLILMTLIMAIIIYKYKYKKQGKKKEQGKPEFKPLLNLSEIKDIEKPSISINTVQKSNINQLKDYLKRNLEQGKKEDYLKNLCLKSGWSEEEINSCLNEMKPEISRKDASNKMYSYVSYEISKGMSDFYIREKLLKAGWKKEEIEKAISAIRSSIKEMQARKSAEEKKAEDQKWAEKKLQEKIGKKETKKQKSKK